MNRIDYYHKNRRNLLLRIQEENGRDSEEVSCRECSKSGYEPDKFHIHHINKEDGYESGIGGLQHYRNCRDDFEAGIELEILCPKCHKNKDGSLFEPEVEEVEL